MGRGKGGGENQSSLIESGKSSVRDTFLTFAQGPYAFSVHRRTLAHRQRVNRSGRGEQGSCIGSDTWGARDQK